MLAWSRCNSKITHGSAWGRILAETYPGKLTMQKTNLKYYCRSSWFFVEQVEETVVLVLSNPHNLGTQKGPEKFERNPISNQSKAFHQVRD